MLATATLHLDALGTCRITALRGAEAIGELPSWTVDLLHEDPAVDLEALPGAPATLELTDEAGDTRPVPLLVTRATYAGPHRDDHRYRLDLSSALWPLTLRGGYRVLRDVTSRDAVEHTLRDAGVPAAAIAWRLVGRYAQRAQCVQYAESDWGFVERLLADEGISYWIDEGGEGRQRLVLGDAATAHEPIDGGAVIRFEDPSAMSSSATAFFELALTERLAHDAVHVRGYDPRHPDVLVEGRAGGGSLEWFDYPVRVPVADAAEARAKARLEQLRRLAVEVRARGGSVRARPGRFLRIEGATDEAFDGEWLVVRVEHELVEASRGTTSARPYLCTVTLVPRTIDGEAFTFRPTVPAVVPRIDGIETATVTGPRGEEIHVDDLGCVRVAHAWDPSGIDDDRSSRWVRTLQPNQSGAMLLPRVGWEVALAYHDGDPDQPVVLAHLYNGDSPPPYSLPSNAATSSLQSASSPANGGTNEIRFGDSAGGQEMMIHASGTQAVEVGGPAELAVGVDQVLDVKKGLAMHVVGAQTTTVGGSQEIVVTSDHGLVVKGGRTELIAASETIGVTLNRRVGAGAYAEVVGAVHAIQSNGAFTTIVGTHSELTGGSLVEVAALGTHQGVTAPRTEMIGGGLAYVAFHSYAEEVSGAKTTTVGPVTEKAGGDCAIVAGSGSIQVSGAATVNAGGKVHIEGATVTVTAASLTAKGGSTLTVGGGAKAAGGTTKLAGGTVSKKSGAKEEA